jgi:hypothetical protein
MSQLIVLGWDALDAELIEEYGLESCFGETKKIETYANPVIDEPHTRELWPSMITGLHPDKHGIHAVSDTDGVDWDSAWLDWLSTITTGVVPKSLRTVIGKRLRERGAGLDAKRPTYYRKNGVATVFEDGDRAISIPNYLTSYDEEHDLDGNRDDVWASILPDRDGSEGMEPNVGVEEIWATLATAVGDRLGHTLAAIEAGHSLTWTWFGLLDTVGHIAPAVDAALEERAYHLAAKTAETIREAAPADATVVSVSDHGLQDGDHTQYATLATESIPAHSAIDHVFDVAGWIETARSWEAPSEVGYGDGVGEMTDRLESLGYIEG